MIIPEIPVSDTIDVSSLEQQVRHWALFGQVALTGCTGLQCDRLESVLKRCGGCADVLIEFDPAAGFAQPGDLEASALRLLNAGAFALVCDRESADAFETLPLDRTLRRIVDVPDQAVAVDCLVDLPNASASRLAELEMARVDALVPVDWLEANVALAADFLEQVLVTDRPDGLWSTVIVDPLGRALGLAYSDSESLRYAIENRVGAYHSRSRSELWVKGESSGATQQLLGIRLDCDRDCLHFRVTQSPPGFCHRKIYTCFGQQRTIQSVTQRLADRIAATDEKSFTRKLAQDPSMLEAKLLEEAAELALASRQDDVDEVTWEAADVLYFTLVAMTKHDVGLESVYEELARRMNRVVRRKNKLEKET